MGKDIMVMAGRGCLGEQRTGIEEVDVQRDLCR